MDPQSQPVLTEAPLTVWQRAIQILLGVVLVGAVPAIFSRHFPSEMSIRIAQGAAALVGAWCAWECRIGGAFGREVTRDPSWMMRSIWTRAPLMVLFVFFMTFTAVEDGVLALATAIVGQPGSQVLTVTGVGHSRKRCDYFRVREAAWLLDQALCASDEDLVRARPGDRLTIFGRRSAFGVNVESYALSEPAA